MPVPAAKADTAKADVAKPNALSPAAFLALQLPHQAGLLAHYSWQDQQVWLKKAGARHGMAVYRLLGLIAALARLPALQPVPNLGGQAAIATEVRRLQTLAAAGVRVPQVLAAQENGFLMSHLGRAGQHTPTLADEIEHASRSGEKERALHLWREGLDFLAAVHAQGLCLSQAFARNFVRCADGALGAVDFEDDPSAALPLPLCQLRDVLSYVHSLALYLQEAQELPRAASEFKNWMAQLAAPGTSPGLAKEIQTTVQRLAWLRFLPQSRRFGRDAQRLRAAYDLLRQSTLPVPY